MNAREVRDELLGQHEALRRQIARTRRDIEAWSHGALESPQMRKEVDDLSTAIRKHNLREEELLGDVIRLAGGRDSGRTLMDERHREEHAELDTALTLKGAAMEVEPAAWEFVMKQLLGQLLEHMNHEETSFINAEVLRAP